MAIHHHQHLVRQIKRQLLGGRPSDTPSGSDTPSAAPTTAAAPSSVPPTTAPATAPTPSAPSTTPVIVESSTPVSSTPPTVAVVTSISTRSSSSVLLSPSSSPLSSLSSRSILSSVAPLTSAPTLSHGSVPSNVWSSGTISSSAAGMTQSAGAGDGTGTSAGTVVGIVAGSLLGLAVLGGLVGMLLKSKWGKNEDDEYQDNPFGNDKDFAVLPDSSSNSSRFPSHSQMPSPLPGRPLPLRHSHDLRLLSPRRSRFQRRPLGPQLSPSLPSFQPGQVVTYGNTGLRSVSPQHGPPPMGPSMGQFTGGYGMGGGPEYGNPASGYGAYGPPGGYGPMDGEVAMLERQASQYHSNPNMARQPSFAHAHAGQHQQSVHLQHQPSMMMHPHGGQQHSPPPQQGMALGGEDNFLPGTAMGGGSPPHRPLSFVPEEPGSPLHTHPDAGPLPHPQHTNVQRSGTPTNPNLQQSYFHHREDSFGSHSGTGGGGPGSPVLPLPGGGAAGPMGQGSMGMDMNMGFDMSPRSPSHSQSLAQTQIVGQAQAQGPHQEEGVMRQLTGRVGKEERAVRTLSVRNGGLDFGLPEVSQSQSSAHSYGQPQAHGGVGGRKDEEDAYGGI